MRLRLRAGHRLSSVQELRSLFNLHCLSGQTCSVRADCSLRAAAVALPSALRALTKPLYSHTTTYSQHKASISLHIQYCRNMQYISSCDCSARQQGTFCVQPKLHPMQGIGASNEGMYLSCSVTCVQLQSLLKHGCSCLWLFQAQVSQATA